MSSGRYYTGLVTGILSIVGFTIFLSVTEAFENVFESLVIAYIIGAFASELIWWDTLPTRLMKAILAFSIVPIGFALGMLFNGSIIGLIIGLLLFSPTAGIFASVAAFGITLGIFLSAIFFIFHIFSLRRDLY